MAEEFATFHLKTRQNRSRNDRAGLGDSSLLLARYTLGQIKVFVKLGYSDWQGLSDAELREKAKPFSERLADNMVSTIGRRTALRALAWAPKLEEDVPGVDRTLTSPGPSARLPWSQSSCSGSLIRGSHTALRHGTAIAPLATAAADHAPRLPPMIVWQATT